MNTDAIALMEKNGQAHKPRTVLFVCTGNTCRSPMAAALYNDMTLPREVCSACDDSDLEPVSGVAYSAGLYAADGDPISAEALSVLQQSGVRPVEGVEYTAHTARRVTREMIEEADVVVGITAAHAMELTMRFPQCAGKITAMPMDVTDPYGRGENAYRTCLLQLRYCLQLLCRGEKA